MTDILPIDEIPAMIEFNFLWLKKHGYDCDKKGTEYLARVAAIIAHDLINGKSRSVLSCCRDIAAQNNMAHVSIYHAIQRAVCSSGSSDTVSSAVSALISWQFVGV